MMNIGSSVSVLCLLIVLSYAQVHENSNSSLKMIGDGAQDFTEVSANSNSSLEMLLQRPDFIQASENFDNYMGKILKTLFLAQVRGNSNNFLEMIKDGAQDFAEVHEYSNSSLEIIGDDTRDFAEIHANSNNSLEIIGEDKQGFAQVHENSNNSLKMIGNGAQDFTEVHENSNNSLKMIGDDAQDFTQVHENSNNSLKMIEDYAQDFAQVNENSNSSLEMIFKTEDFAQVHKSFNNSLETIDDDEEVLRQWLRLELRVKQLSKYGVMLLLPRILKAQDNMNLSQQCTKQTIMTVKGLEKIEPWAVRLFDASAKMANGLLTGTISSLGAYDQCITTYVKDKESPHNKDKVLFQGKYCALNLRPPLPKKPRFYKLDEVLPVLKNFTENGTAIGEAAKYANFFYFIPLRLGVCVPSGCTNEDVQQWANIIGGYFYLSTSVYRCELEQEKEFTPSIISVITILIFLGLLMFIGSMMDLYKYYFHKGFNTSYARILLCFSLISNFKKFSDTKTSSGTLSCLNGIRFLSMAWIVVGHTYLIVNFHILRGLETLKDFAEDFAFQAIANATVAVDTFFSIGGLLVVYVTLNVVHGMGKKFSVRMYILHRLWRILPVYSMIVAFTFTAGVMGNGPLWYETLSEYSGNCRENWWTNLLFINNYYDVQNMCIFQSWYIATDMQLYLASLVVLMPLLRWPKIGLTVAAAGAMLSMALSGVITYIYNFPPGMLFSHPDPVQRDEYREKMFFKPYIHAGPYCVGMIAGYILATKPKLRIPKVLLICGWCMAIITNMSVLYGVWEWNKGRDPTFWENMLYSSFNRTAWSAGVCWMIVCCATGHGGVVNYILSWKCFVPLGRLTFIVYLIHPLIQAAVMAYSRSEIQPAHYFVVWMYLGHLCVSYGSAFAGSMLVESPFLALEKIIMPRNGSEKTHGQISLHNNSQGSLKTAKNVDLATVMPTERYYSEGIENGSFVCKL